MNKKPFSGKLVMSVILFTTSVIVTLISTLGWFVVIKPRNESTSFEVTAKELEIKFFEYQFSKDTPWENLDSNGYPIEDCIHWNDADPNIYWEELENFYLGETILLPKQKLCYKIEVTNLSDTVTKVINCRFLNLSASDPANPLADLLWVRMWCDILTNYNTKPVLGRPIIYDANDVNNDFWPFRLMRLQPNTTAKFYYIIEFSSESVAADFAGATLSILKIRIDATDE